MSRNIYWGDSHCNIRSWHMDRIDEVFDEAAHILDFFPVAYYPFAHEDVNGLQLETWGQRPEFLPEWEKLCDAVRRHNRPGEFVTFPGYEWHGDRTRWGDHNVFFNSDAGPLLDTADAADLFVQIKKLGGIAVPHHTAYRIGSRGKDWSVFDEDAVPFAEIYSGHGNSEAIGVWPEMKRNTSMGPRVSGGTVQDGLAKGLRVGIIASNESHSGFPARWGSGLMAAAADDLTREGLWEAFMARRVYGVTGDRIGLEFSANGHEMGERFGTAGPVELTVKVDCCAALDRVEILRNNRVMSTHCHKGTWRAPGSGRARAKVRVTGTGGPSGYVGFDDTEDRVLPVSFSVPGGRVISAEPCFTVPGCRIGEAGGERLDLELRLIARREFNTVNAQSVVVEFEADCSRALKLEAAGESIEIPVADAMERTALLPLVDESRERIWKRFDCTDEQIHNKDVYYAHAYKVLLGRADPEAAFAAEVSAVDDAPEPGLNWYYVRVTQENGQMAWSSPIWVDSGRR